LKHANNPASARLEDNHGRPILTRRSLSLRRQSSNLEKVSNGSYFNLPSTPLLSDGSTPPPPYCSPSSDDGRDEDKRWIDLLERQNTELMEQITTLSAHANPLVTRKGRPISFHGTSQQVKEQPADLQSIISSNILIQKQLSTMREELVRARRRCAELSEVEASKKGLELRCLGLERVVEELMSAINMMKTHQTAQNTPPKNTRQSKDECKGLAINIEDSASTENTNKSFSLHDTLGAFLISTRRKFIPYRVRAVVLFIHSRLQIHDLIDQLFGAGVIIMGAIMWAGLLVLERGRKLINPKMRKSPEARGNK
jgi:hypothetical protein